MFHSYPNLSSNEVPLTDTPSRYSLRGFLVLGNEVGMGTLWIASRGGEGKGESFMTLHEYHVNPCKL